MSYNNNFNDNLVIHDNDDEYIQNNQEQKMVSNKDSKKNYEKQLYERIFVFGNFFGLVPKGFENSEEFGEVIKLTGDQKVNVCNFLINEEICTNEDIIIKGI